MFLVDKLILVILVGTLGAQVLYRRSFWFSQVWLKKLGEFFNLSFTKGDDDEKHFFNKSFSFFVKIIWFVSIGLILFVVLKDSIHQYFLWEGNKFSRFLLPPYTSLGYFVSYIFTRFFLPWVVAFLFSILISRLARRLNRRFGERFFENEEIDLMALGIFLTGYPGFLFYLATVLTFGSLFSAVYTIFYRSRMPLYYFWMPLAIFAMIIKGWLIPVLGLNHFWSQFILGDFSRLIFGF